MLGDQKWHDRVDRVVERAADRISKELEKMVGALHQDAAPQMAMELLGRRLIERQPQLLAWLELQSKEAQADMLLAQFCADRRRTRR
jgi:hypothetical protein